MLKAGMTMHGWIRSARPARAGLLGIVIWLLAIVPHAALGDSRVALVIGNAAYRNASALANPRNDAEAVAAELERVGFKVVKGIDLDQVGMRAVIRDFDAALANADVGLFYYAGHGLQVDGHNYLVPVDAELKREVDLNLEATDLNVVLQLLQRSVPTSLVFLDACRDNPFAQTLARSMGPTRSISVGRGLALVESAVGSFIAYATQPENVALDGDGADSPFAAALLKHIETPGLSIADLMIRVRNDVIAATHGKQVPWDHSSLTGSFYFVAQPSVAGTSSGAPAPDNGAVSAPSGGSTAVEIAFWDSVKDSNDPAQVQAYLQSYPHGSFAAIARIRLEHLRPKEANAAPAVAMLPPAADDTADMLATLRSVLPADVPFEEAVVRTVLTDPAFQIQPTTVTQSRWHGTFVKNHAVTIDVAARWKQLTRGFAAVRANTQVAGPTGAVVLLAQGDTLAVLNGALTLSSRQTFVANNGNETTQATITSVTKEISQVTGKLFPMAVGNQLQFHEIFEETLNKAGETATTRYVAEDQLKVTGRIRGDAAGLPWNEEVFEVSFEQDRRDEQGALTQVSGKNYFVPSLRAFVELEDGGPADPMYARMNAWQVQ